MTETSAIHLVEEAEKLWQRWRWVRWLMLGIGLLLLVGGFILFEIHGQNIYADAFQSPPILSMLGAGILGSSLAHWNGSKELKLLMAFKRHHESKSSET